MDYSETFSVGVTLVPLQWIGGLIIQCNLCGMGLERPALTERWPDCTGQWYGYITQVLLR